ncbi:ATP-dependent 6-phosphofructokinase [Rubrobacter tropicus]|uniref:ATP-dependent 6-phosphofructokinase n=1 Tax=Rubrobacter tropicus TaxID=2653851 RepID=UPI001A9E980F|nr:ATP-dependent 6-phosphofructokinase [Rubrobacter tropicus]
MRVAVLTSGGDAPGMNGAIRAATRTAFVRDWEVLGVPDGYRGLLEGRFRRLTDRTMGGILHRGGTILGTAREPQLLTEEGQRQGLAALKRAGVEGLVVIGGGGSLKGALALAKLGVPTVGVPATIDNDVPFTDMSIGVDTALNTALEAIDRIKDTASSHRRAHVVEVMGRNCGYLALACALAAGAEAVLLPEHEPHPEDLLGALASSYERGKPHFIVVAAEGSGLPARKFHEYVNAAEDTFESRLTILGHVQRGGSPTAYDRLLGSRLGAAALRALAEGEPGIMVGVSGRRLERFPLEDVAAGKKHLDEDTYDLALTLAGMHRRRG